LQALVAIELAGVGVRAGRRNALLAIGIADQAGSAVEDTNAVLKRAKPGRDIIDACVAVAVAGLSYRATILAGSVLSYAADRRRRRGTTRTDHTQGEQA
jgi:hypothetical protein